MTRQRETAGVGGKTQREDGRKRRRTRNCVSFFFSFSRKGRERSLRFVFLSLDLSRLLVFAHELEARDGADRSGADLPTGGDGDGFGIGGTSSSGRGNGSEFVASSAAAAYRHFRSRGRRRP